MADNRQTALKMLERLGEGVLDEDIVTADFTAWIPGQGTVQKADFLKLMALIGSILKNKAVMKIVGVTAEGDRVAVEAESFGELTNGKIYNNTYHFLFLFRDGKIYQSKEYNDTKYAIDTLAELFSA